MVIGADGVKSIVRSCVVGSPDAPTPSGDALYRAVLSTDAFLKDPDLRPLVEESEFSIWMGQGKMVYGYCMVSPRPLVRLQIRGELTSHVLTSEQARNII